MMHYLSVMPETPQEDIRNALQILGELDGQVLKLALFAGGAADVVAYELLHLTASARRRLWEAITKLEGGTRN